MKTILIVEDEKKIREFIHFFMEREGYRVLEARNGAEAISCMRTEDISLVIMDLMMPVMNGFEACQAIRKFSDVPIIMLTAVEGEQDHIEGYAAGADDYITKPFKINILMAKVNRILGKTDQGFHQVKEIKINHERRMILLEDQKLQFTPKEYDLLNYLILHKNAVLSRDQILDAVWGIDFEGGTRVVDNHIRKLRSKMGSFSKRITTVVGYGYKIEV